MYLPAYVLADIDPIPRVRSDVIEGAKEACRAAVARGGIRAPGVQILRVPLNIIAQLCIAGGRSLLTYYIDHTLPSD